MLDYYNMPDSWGIIWRKNKRNNHPRCLICEIMICKWECNLRFSCKGVLLSIALFRHVDSSSAVLLMNLDCITTNNSIQRNLPGKCSESPTTLGETQDWRLQAGTVTYHVCGEHTNVPNKVSWQFPIHLILLCMLQSSLVQNRSRTWLWNQH